MTRIEPDRTGSDRTKRHPKWPDRLIELGRLLLSESHNEEPRAELWLLLNSVLRQQIRRETPRIGKIGPEDLCDLAADKSLDLMTKLDNSEWDLVGSSRQRVIAFVSKVARNGLIDHLRQKSRRPLEYRADIEDDGVMTPIHRMGAESSDTRVERDDYVKALLGCLEATKDQHRKIWLFRVFLEMSSKQIGNHPEIQLVPSHVDVVMQRTREHIRACMEKKKFSPTPIPRGTFSELWRALRLRDQSTQEPE